MEAYSKDKVLDRNAYLGQKNDKKTNNRLYGKDKAEHRQTNKTKTKDQLD